MMKLAIYFSCFAYLSVVYSGSTCHTKHSCKLEQLGCFNDKEQARALPEEILNERDRSSKVYGNRLIEWMNFKTYLDGFACRCAQKAAEKGYTVIGLQFFGECWSGPNAAVTYHRHGKSSKCIDGNFQDFDNSSGCVQHIGTQWTNIVYRIGTPGCEEKFEPVGCFHDNLLKPRPVPYYLMNERDPTYKRWNGRLIQWGLWKTYSPKMVCRCAEAARLNGDTYFAIQFWGECWSGKSNDTSYNRNGISTNCRDENFEECACNSYICVGKASTNYVYKLC